jgi:hypothetical protein
MVQRICNNSHNKADGIKMATPSFTAHSFSSGSNQAASAAKEVINANMILTYVT